MPQRTTLFLLCLAGIYLVVNYEAMTIVGILTNILAIIVFFLCTLVFSYGGDGVETQNMEHNGK